MPPTTVAFPRDSWWGSPCLDGALPVGSAEEREALAGSSTLIKAMDELPHFHGSSKSHGFSRTVVRGASEGGQGPGMLGGQRPPECIQGIAGGKEGDIAQDLMSLGKVALELL